MLNDGAANCCCRSSSGSRADARDARDRAAAKRCDGRCQLYPQRAGHRTRAGRAPPGDAPAAERPRRRRRRRARSTSRRTACRAIRHRGSGGHRPPESRRRCSCRISGLPAAATDGRDTDEIRRAAGRHGDRDAGAGAKVEGRLDRIDDFIVTLILADGTRRTFRRVGDVPKVEINDPLAVHTAAARRPTPTATCTTSRPSW